MQRLTDIQTLRRAGKVTIHRDDKTDRINSTVIFRTPDHIRYLYETKGYTMTAGSNGDDIWRRIEITHGATQYSRLDGLDRILIEIDLMTLKPFSDSLWREGALALLPAGSDDSDAPYVIERRSGRYVDKMTINAGHFLCTQRDISFKSAEAEGPNSVTVEYGDYRYVDEIPMPFLVTTSVDATLSNTTQVSEIVVNPGVLSYVFGSTRATASYR